MENHPQVQRPFLAEAMPLYSDLEHFARSASRFFYFYIAATAIIKRMQYMCVSLASFCTCGAHVGAT